MKEEIENKAFLNTLFAVLGDEPRSAETTPHQNRLRCCAFHHNLSFSWVLLCDECYVSISFFKGDYQPRGLDSSPTFLFSFLFFFFFFVAYVYPKLTPLFPFKSCLIHPGQYKKKSTVLHSNLASK